MGRGEKDAGNHVYDSSRDVLEISERPPDIGRAGGWLVRVGLRFPVEWKDDPAPFPTACLLAIASGVAGSARPRTAAGSSFLARPQSTGLLSSIRHSLGCERSHR